jgi:hypothetical protein
MNPKLKKNPRRKNHPRKKNLREKMNKRVVNRKAKGSDLGATKARRRRTHPIDVVDFVAFISGKTLCTTHPPMNTHIPVIIFPPVYIIHLNALQCGVGAINGDRKNPYAVGGVQKYVYK